MKLESQATQRFDPRVELSYYSCRLCGGYHLTKSVGGGNPKLR